METELFILCTVSFLAGFIDSIVGGGGLLQTPAMLIVLPQYPIATLFGTTKIPSITGTAFAAYQYSRKVSFDRKLIRAMLPFAFCGAMLGAYSISLINGKEVKPLVLVLLLVVAIYTYSHKSFGLQEQKDSSKTQNLLIGILSGLAIGFYDGLIGPGTGTFLILTFIGLLNNDFLQASVHAKFINVATNLAALIYFASTGHILYQYALPMAVFNLAGSFLGTRLAILKGNRFIRVLFLLVVFGTILRFAYDIFQ